MHTAAPQFPSRSGPMGFFSRAEAWLDARGRGAWIAAMVLGFILFWPVGLAFVLYMTMSGKWSMGRTRRATKTYGPTSGNTAFDAYKDATLRRLEEESRAFDEFLNRLREAKDKAEFDEFMDKQAQNQSNDNDDGEKDGKDAA